MNINLGDRQGFLIIWRHRFCLIEVMRLRRVIHWALRIVALALVIKFALWLYQSYRSDMPAQTQQELLDIDMECSVIPDTGECLCYNHWTNERLTIPYRKCLSLAHRN